MNSRLDWVEYHCDIVGTDYDSYGIKYCF